MKFISKYIFLSVVIVLVGYGCSSTNTNYTKIVIKGSTTMLPLTEILAAEYMKLNPGVSIYAYGGGTTTGVKALITGDVDICQASRTLTPEEAKLLAEYYKSVGVFYLVAKDAITVYTNKANPVENITVEQLKDIYTCRITNWKELGGNDEYIHLINRFPNSGTYIYFKFHVLEGANYCEGEFTAANTEEVISIASKNKNSIGFGGLTENTNVKHLKVQGVVPVEENARNDSYPITRYLFYFLKNKPSGEVKKYIDWVISPQGQKIIKNSGYVSLWNMDQPEEN